MKKELLLCDDVKIPVYVFRTIIIGSGCAGFNAADCLYDMSETDIAILTEGINMGTSRNTGSDKQTYYKLSLASDGLDSVKELAQNLFEGGGVNGDTALAEAAGSVRAFMKLVQLNVPFPTNAYGEYVGYKTDHDPRQRATSAGPLTSKYMTECLERSVNSKGITTFDHMQVISLLVENGEVKGAVGLDLNNLDTPSYGLVLFRCANVIMATGGPAGVYFHSVYPESQTGASGMAFEAGAEGANLQQWQYGLASTKFRWNVSGTYQQVLPRYISVNSGGEAREFLPDYFETQAQALNQVFLKGYQWPFDINKINGSSIIDLIIHHEIFVKSNRVFMDFTQNPAGLDDGFSLISHDAYEYLSRSQALESSPVKRLAKMNPKAIELYRTHGIDLYTEPLEVSICAQHHNGGIAVDVNWQSNIKGLFAVGEAAGTFGAYRPGGSALNSTQVGSMRAAEYIAYDQAKSMPAPEVFSHLAQAEVCKLLRQFKLLLENADDASNIAQDRVDMQKKMSANAAHLRSINTIDAYYQTVCEQLDNFYENHKIKNCMDIPHMMKNRDLLITQAAILSAMRAAALQIGSNGSGLVLDETGELVSNKLFSICYRPENEEFRASILYTQFSQGKWESAFRAVRPIPELNDWFEVVWSEYEKRRGKA